MTGVRGDWAPKNMLVAIDGDPLEGFGPTDFFSAEKRTADNSLEMGVDDTGTRSQIHDSSFTFTLTTKYGSSATQRLSRIRQDYLGGVNNGVFNLEFFDPASLTKIGGARSWIEAPPAVTGSTAAPDLEWTLTTATGKLELNELPLL